MIKLIPLMLLGLFAGFWISGCEKPERLPPPYSAFQPVGWLGHGRGILGELQVTTWGAPQRCDTCHYVSKTIHPNLGSCNRCHQPHPSGWRSSLAAIYHDESLPLVEQEHHFSLKCTECHVFLDTPETYKAAQCIECHDHNKRYTQAAHEVLFKEEFDITRDYKNERCVDCHARTGKNYADFHHMETGDYNY